MDQPDQHMKAREAEKLADLESLADALAAFRQMHRDLDQWGRVHLALGLAAVVSGCYGIGELEAALVLTPEIERSPSAKLPSDPVYERFDLALFERALSEAWAEPARRFPHFGRVGSGSVMAGLPTTLAAAKARGTKLGNPANLSVSGAVRGRALGTAAAAERAGKRLVDLDPVIRTIQADGKTSLNQIAKALNERRVPASRGGSWSVVQVSRILARIPQRAA